MKPVSSAHALALIGAILVGGCSPAQPQDTAASRAANDQPVRRISRECANVTIPARIASISDTANLLTPAVEARLNGELAAYAETTGHEAVIAVVPSLGGQSDSLVARCIGDSWAIGDATRKDGLLILLAPNDQRIRVAMGSAFGEAEADVKAQHVITAMMPKLNQSDWGGGLSDGIVKMREVFP